MANVIIPVSFAILAARIARNGYRKWSENKTEETLRELDKGMYLLSMSLDDIDSAIEDEKKKEAEEGKEKTGEE